MKKHLALSLGLFLVAPLTFAQNNRDFKKLEKGQKSMDRNLEKIEKYFGQDMSAKFQCFPEYQASFEDLKTKVLTSVEEGNTNYNTIVNNIKEQLAPHIAELKA